MIGVYLEVTARCGACGGDSPVSGFQERAACARCAQPLAFAFERWRDILNAVVHPDRELGSREQVASLSDSARIVAGREDPACSNCHAALPDEIAQLAGRGHAMCPACGLKIAVRVPPPELAPALAGAELVIGEGATVAPAAPGSGPITLHCANCRAPLPVDGTSRAVTCAYCSVDTFLPDDVWLRLHPAMGTARFYLYWPSAAAVAAHAVRAFEWSSLDDVELGRDGNLYAIGSQKDGMWTRGAVAWCMGPDLVPRWVSPPLGDNYSEAHLALDTAGRVLVWRDGKHSADVLAAADGASLGKLGGEEPAGATVHHFDLARGKALVCDADGTLLALIGEHLVRFTPDGTGVATWPPRAGLFGKKAEKLGPLYRNGSVIDVDGAFVERLAHQPTTLDHYSKLAIGWDGMLYLERSEWLAKLDRTGHIIYKVRLPLGSCDDGIGADTAGNAYVAGSRDNPQCRVLLRVSPDGKRVDEIAQDTLHGGVLCSDRDQLVVAPDGTLYCLRYDMAVRILDRDGRLVRITEPARAADEAARQRQAENA